VEPEFRMKDTRKRRTQPAREAESRDDAARALLRLATSEAGDAPSIVAPAAPEPDDVDIAALFGADPTDHLEAAGVRPSPFPSGRVHGVVVEIVRLFMVALFALTGWEIAAHLGPDDPERLLAATLLGTGVGYVAGGAFGRRTASAVVTSTFSPWCRRVSDDSPSVSS
jgi:hypothetical protein